MAQEEKQDKLPLDAKLLSDAVIELNISRRSVGIYPPEHPVVRASIERAFNHLQSLFAIRSSITLGIAKDALVVDEYILDRKNLVFREFAQSLHAKGIASITFSDGLSEAGLTRFHELITARDMPVGKELAERAANDISFIKLSPIDFSSFAFIEGAQRTEAASGDIWEDYIYGLLEGRLSDGGDDERILAVSPEKVADIVNTAMTKESSRESYDRVIAAYITSRKKSRISRYALTKFLSFLDRLSPEVKQEFLSRSCRHFSEDIGNFDAVIREMTPEEFDKIAGLFSENASQVPESLRHLMQKLSSVRSANTMQFDFFYDKTAVLHDIELGEDVIKLFGDDNVHAYVSEEYRQELDRMLSSRGSFSTAFEPFRKECDEKIIDTVALDIMLDLLQEDFLAEEDYRTIGAKLIEFLGIFIETGRFQQIYETYEMLHDQSTGGRVVHEAAGIIDYFRSDEFIAGVVDAITFWGRKERDSAMRLAGALRQAIISPLIAALEEQKDPSIRKFLLSVLGSMGGDVLPHAVARLNDKQWFVVRNMIYIIRECNGIKDADKIRRLVRHEHATIRMEAVKTLLHFGTPDAVSHLRSFLRNPDPEIRKGAIRMAGTYKVCDVVPQLIEDLERRDMLGAETDYKTDIIRALGDIGDARAIGPLQRLYSSFALFNRGNREDLKIEIFKSLDKYPHEAARKLIEQGLSSKNQQIRALSEKYLMAIHTSSGMRR